MNNESKLLLLIPLVSGTGGVIMGSLTGNILLIITLTLFCIIITIFPFIMSLTSD